MDKYVPVCHNDPTTVSSHYYYRYMLCVSESERVMVCDTDVYVCVCGRAGGQTWWSPVSRWLCGASQPWRGCHNYQLSSVREMTHSLFNKTCHPDRQTDGQRAWRTVRQAGGKTKDTACEYFNCRLNPRNSLVSLQTAENWKKAVGVIGPQRRRSEVNGLIWGLTPFKTNLRRCVIVPLTKFLTWSV